MGASEISEGMVLWDKPSAAVVEIDVCFALVSLDWT